MKSFVIEFLKNYLKVTYSSKGLVGISYTEKVHDLPGPRSATEKSMANAIKNYLEQKEEGLSLAIDWNQVDGTPFQKQVWKELAKIPFGKVKTYGEIAESLGKPGASRAVGTACGKNPLMLVVPCHRVVGRSGLGGFSGGGLPVKRQLLSLESSLH